MAVKQFGRNIKMKNIKDICFIIQARLSSERVPRKMIKPFAGTSLVDIACKKINQSIQIPNENFYFSAPPTFFPKPSQNHPKTLLNHSQPHPKTSQN